MLKSTQYKLNQRRIVEYATRDQAQQAVNTLSNQNLMGRLVYVREVSFPQLSTVLNNPDWKNLVNSAPASMLMIPCLGS